MLKWGSKVGYVCDLFDLARGGEGEGGGKGERDSGEWQELELWKHF